MGYNFSMQLRAIKRLGALACLLLVLTVVTLPFGVYAAGPLENAIVPACDRVSQDGVGFSGACQLCDLVKLANNMVHFAVALSVIVATLMFAYAGFLYVTAASKPDNIKTAHGIFVKVFVGLVIILVAWLVVDIIMKTLASNEVSGPWKEIECIDYPDNDGQDLTPADRLPIQSGDTGTGTGGAGSTSVTCPDCQDVTVFTPKSGVNRGAAAALHAKLTAFHSALGNKGSWLRITEGWPPRSSAHVGTSRHNNGTAVDMGFTNDGFYTPANITDVIQAATGVGLGIVYEVPYATGSSQCTSARAAFSGSVASHVSCNDDATDKHFHVTYP
jgi:hypothetical protein